ncbi:MAG: SCO family protein [Rhodospirillales bacterium]|nr:SCO family protein [Rhodospirillales bacterium]
MAKPGKGKGGGKGPRSTNDPAKKPAPKPPPRVEPITLSQEQPSFISRHSGALLVVALVGIIFLSGHRVFFGPKFQPRQTSQQVQQAVLSAIGGPFSLVNQLGQSVTEADFKGRFMLIYFGYTYCPDICPAALTDIGIVLDDLGAAADRIAPIFITVDPLRDTPEYLKEYLSHFDPRLIGLTGTEAQIAAVAKAYKIFYKKEVPAPGAEAPAHAHAHAEGAAEAHAHEADEGDYDVSHMSIMFLMGPDGVYRTRFSHGTSVDDIARGIRKFL